MEGGGSSDLPVRVPDDDQPEGQGSEPAASEDPGTLESSTLLPKRKGLEAPEEEEEFQGPLREQDLKEAYIQLVHGVQEWQDGCVYQGHFGLDMKLGYGEFSWPTGESYHGQFYRDHRHGFGTYEWPDGSRFTGMFYLSFREGYGTLYMKTKLFQGLYKADERFGPGVETYPDGCQDVGLWFREHLVKLCTEIPSGFSMRSYPEFAGFLRHCPARVSLSEEETMQWDLQEERDPFFYDYKRFLLNDDLILPPDLYIYSTDNTHMPITRSFRRDLDSRLFLHDIPPFVEDGEPWFIKNETPLMVKIQKQAYKFRNRKEHSSWNMGAILEGDRSGFACRGPRERLAREMILKAEEGNYDWIFGILRDNLASPDVADARGYTVLAAAAVHCHTNIVNLLLDNGADVNKCSDEGLTPLSMCFIVYYSTRSFKANIAERTVLEPQFFSKEVPKLTVTQSHSALRNAASTYSDPLAPTPGSQESVGQRGSPQKWASTPPRGSVSEVDRGLGDTLESLDQCSLYTASETNFESNLCVQNFPFELSRDMLERSAQAYSMLQVSSGDTGSDKGTMRQMALSMIEHRNRWLTIHRLLHRGADPNLCRVPMQVLFFPVKAGDVDGVKLLLENGARTDIQFPPELGALTPLHIAAALPGEEGVKITELLLHAITDVDARATDQDDVYKASKLDLLPSSMKLNNETGPPSIYYSTCTSVPDEGGRTPLHVACEREDNHRCARDIVQLLLSHRANTSLLWSGHSPLSLSIASGNDLVVKELLSHGADPNLLLTKGLGSALCVACDIFYEHWRSMDRRLALIDQLINYGADMLAPVTLTQGDKVAVGTVVDYGYFKFYQDRKIAHCPFHTLMPAEREIFLARKRLLEYVGFQLRRAVLAKEGQWDPKLLYLSKRAQLMPCHRLKQKGPSPFRVQHLEELEQIPFFKFCSQCGRSVGVRLLPCSRCYGILTCSKSCKTRAWMDFHGRDCSTLMALGRLYLPMFKQQPQKPPKSVDKCQKPRCPQYQKKICSSYSQE
ncbi:PREDICTED: ankyrin repeat and MYND domain-containing protein 1 [Miniopterus natalensis]|uniref:ankyrin repeat and MYND domain-containing protein 1 n=1 Tax=Miniopterus natalensis TaxID=291302 RepID=UPI0007A6F182|nr:PREDICTED: ankyrin repeat and MYND domain-containing protein 1 [Miniopterus natalensis]